MAEVQGLFVLIGICLGSQMRNLEKISGRFLQVQNLRQMEEPKGPEEAEGLFQSDWAHINPSLIIQSGKMLPRENELAALGKADSDLTEFL
jgi:hypothetical protein